MTEDAPSENGAAPREQRQHPPKSQPFEIALARKLESRSSSLLDSFLLLDADGDGYVTRSDLKLALHNVLGVELTRSQMNAIFARFAYFDENMVDDDDEDEDGGEYEGGSSKPATPQKAPGSSLDTPAPRTPPIGKSGSSSSDAEAMTKSIKKARKHHGIRYADFVEYVHRTAQDLPSSSSEYGSTLDLHFVEGAGGGARAGAGGLLPKLDSVAPPPDAVTKDLRLALIRKLRSRTGRSRHGGQGLETQLFLMMDSDRSGRVTPAQFRDWLAGVGLVLTDAQVRTILGEHYNPDGIDLREFDAVIEGLVVEERESTSIGGGAASRDRSIFSWESPDPDEVRRRRLATRAVGEEASSKLANAVRLCADDAKTDRDIVNAVSVQILSRRSGLLKAFDRYDVDGTGRLTAEELHGALRDADLDVSEERAASLVAKFDRDGDGRLSKSEFVRLIASGGSAAPAPVAGGGGSGEPDGGASATATTEPSPIPASDGQGDGGGDATLESKRQALVEAVAGHEDEEQHREIASRLDRGDVEALTGFRRAIEEEMMMARRTFQSMDRDGSKDLSAEELRAGFERLGVKATPEHIDHIMARFDPEGTGRLKYNQFVKLLCANLDDE